MPDQKPTKPDEVIRALPSKQEATAAPVILAPHLPSMEKTGEVKTVLRNARLPLMGSGVQQPPRGEGLMAPVPAQQSAPSRLTGKPQERKAAPPSTASGEGYVRVEVHVENGKLSVAGIREVAGPLVMPSAVIHGYAYEVLLDDQQVGLGSLPDVGVRRAFANRDVPEPQGKHFFIEVPAFDFAVRIPKGYLVSANLPKLNVVLLKVEEAPDRFTSLAPLQKQPGVKAAEVGRLAGIKVEELSAGVRPNLERILSENEKLR